MFKMKIYWASLLFVWCVIDVRVEASNKCNVKLENGIVDKLKSKQYTAECDNGFVSNIPNLENIFFKCKGDLKMTAHRVYFENIQPNKIYLDEITCQEKTECQALPELKNAEMKVISKYQHDVTSHYTTFDKSAYFDGDIIKYKCSQGYEVYQETKVDLYDYYTYNYDGDEEEEEEAQTAADTVECMPSGLWNDTYLEDITFIQCKEIFCNASYMYENIKNGNITDYKEIYNYYDSIVLTCDEGYRPKNNMDTVLCSSSTSFEREKDNFGCEPIRCETPTDPVNGRAKVESDLVGGKAYFFCDYGQLIGENEWTCQPDGTWNSSCVVCDDEESYCSPPCLPLGAKLISTENVFYQGSIVEIACADLNINSSIRTCMENKAWSGKPLDCFGTSESGAFMGNSLLSAIEKIQYDKNISDSNETCAECPEARTINVQNGRGNDIYFVIDVSKSITAEKVKLRGRFLKALLPKLGINNEPVGTRLAFYFFASKCIKDINHHYQEEENIFASYKEAQEYLDDTFDKQKLDDLIGKTGKGTSISNALDDVAQDIHGKIVSFNIGQSTRKAEQVVIVISDGQYNTDGNPKTAADALKETPFHAEIFSILVGADERKYPLAFDTMKEIASTIENEKHFFPIRGDQLHEVIGAMIANGSSLNLPCGQTDPFLTNLENDSIPVYEENAQKGAWPWMAELVDVNGVLTCGGSLIDSQWILTAAHCIVDTAKVILKILKHGDQQGIVSFDKTNENYIIHEKYNINKEEKFAYDIALIKLPYEVKISRSLLPVCLPDENYEIKAGVFGVVTGWGRTHSQGNAREHLKQMQMKIQTCENDEHFNNEIMFCAGSEVEDKRVDVCQGDSGGPFVIRIKNDETRFFQTGIVSHGNGCKKEHGVYTKLSPSLVTWIRTKMNQG